MADSLETRLERVWQLLMVIGEDHMARTVAEAKQKLMTQQKQLAGEPQVFTVVMDDETPTSDGAG